MKNDTPKKESSFIRVAPGARVNGLQVEKVKVIGADHFINNHGEVKNSTIKDSEHLRHDPNKDIDDALKKPFAKGKKIVIGFIVLIVCPLIVLILHTEYNFFRAESSQDKTQVEKTIKPENNQPKIQK